MTIINKRAWSAHDYLSRAISYLDIIKTDATTDVNHPNFHDRREIYKIHDLLASADEYITTVWKDEITGNIARKEMRISAARKAFEANELICKTLRGDGTTNLRFHLDNAIDKLIA
jgi:hypothetical protein